MRELGERKRESFAERFVGQKLEVLLEESTEDGELGGYSRNYVRVLTRGATSQLSNPGTLVRGFVCAKLRPTGWGD